MADFFVDEYLLIMYNLNICHVLRINSHTVNIALHRKFLILSNTTRRKYVRKKK